MFGNPDWFRDATQRWPLPQQGKGWLYYFAWLGILILPATLLLSWAYVPEALIWTIVTATLFVLDVRKLRRQSAEKQAYRNLYFIGDNTPEIIETEKYTLEIKD